MRRSLPNLKYTTCLMPVLTFILAAPAAGSNLGAYAISFAHNSIYYPGDDISLECSVINDSFEASEGYTVTCYAGAHRIGRRSRGPLGPQEIESFVVSCSFPEDITTGRYAISMEVDCPDDDYAANDDFTAGWAALVVVPGPPEISVQSVDASDGIFEPGGSIVVKIALEAVGGQLPGACDVDFYASLDKSISTDDLKIHSTSIGSLVPGESYTSDVVFQFPADMPLGRYYIGIIATYPGDDEIETDTACDTTFVYVGVPPDLLVQSVQAAGGTYWSGDSIGISSLIKNVGEQISGDYVIDFYLSADSGITADDYGIGRVAGISLAADEQHSYETTCLLPPSLSVGRYYVGVIVTCHSDGDLTNNVGYDSGMIRIVQPNDVVAGRLTYHDRDGGEHPIRYALVKICDGGSDEVLRETHTDGSGNYSARVPAHGKNAREVRVEVYTQGASGAYPGTTSKICSVRDEVFEEVYRLQSELYLKSQDSSLTVDMAAPNSGGEFMIFDSIVEGFGKAKEFFGIELDEIATFWPNSEDFSYFDPCELEIHLEQDDRGDRDVIIHEYGHHLTFSRDFANGDVGDDGRHYWNADLRYHPSYRNNERARNLAFREAWASLFSIAAQYGDTGYPHSGDAIYQDLDEESEWVLEANLEKDDDEECRPGQYFENMNACVLWDIFDDDGRDTYLDLLSDPGLEKIWLLSRQYKPDDILQFWDGWCETYGYDRKIKYIYRAHQMPYNDPGFVLPPNRPPIADASEDQTVFQTCELGAWVTLNGYGNDPDGDEVKCSWNASAYNRTESDDGTELTAIFPVGKTTATFTVRDYQYIHETTDEVEITVIATDPDEWTDSCF